MLLSLQPAAEPVKAAESSQLRMSRISPVCGKSPAKSAVQQLRMTRLDHAAYAVLPRDGGVAHQLVHLRQVEDVARERLVRLLGLAVEPRQLGEVADPLLDTDDLVAGPV